MLCRQGVEDPDAVALRDNAETMVARGYLERLIIAGTPRACRARRST
jgi:hypothetical protein